MFAAKWLDALERCPDCGNLIEVCSDPNLAAYPQRRVCLVTAARTAAQRRFDEQNRDAQPDQQGLLPGDGVTVWVSLTDDNPDDDFLHPQPL